jgi:hypothetical protein
MIGTEERDLPLCFLVIIFSPDLLSLLKGRVSSEVIDLFLSSDNTDRSTLNMVFLILNWEVYGQLVVHMIEIYLLSTTAFEKFERLNFCFESRKPKIPNRCSVISTPRRVFSECEYKDNHSEDSPQCIDSRFIKDRNCIAMLGFPFGFPILSASDSNK